MSDPDHYKRLRDVTRFMSIHHAVDIAFAEMDLTEISREVLNETAPENRYAVTCAMDALFGDIPTEDPEAEDDEC